MAKTSIEKLAAPADDGVAFRVQGRPLGRALQAAVGGAPLHLAGVVKLDHWQGRPRVTFQIEDAAAID